VDPVTLVVTALAAGASAGMTETASAAVQQAYAGLKTALAERFRGRPAAEVALAEHETSPQTWHAPLTQYVTEIGIDDQLRELAQRLLAAAERAGSDRRVQVTADTIQGQQIGDRNAQTNAYGQ
jgi:hypothetical protein